MFKDSCITKMTPWSVVEEATALPVNIFPAYVGSGSCVVSLDASGLQGLNHGVQKAYRCLQDAGDMYIVRHGYIGDKISENNLLPMGYAEWEMELDGEWITSANLCENASVWTRRIDLDEGRVVTGMLIQEKIRLEIAAWIPFGSLSPVFEINLRGYDYRVGQKMEPRTLRFTLGVHLKTRQGKAIFEEGELKGNQLNLKVDGHETYKTSLALSCVPAIAPEYRDDWYGITWNTVVDSGNEPSLQCMFHFDDSQDQPVESLGDHLITCRKGNRTDWEEFYRNSADMEGIDLRESFLYHNSLYLLRAGFQFDKGIPIGIPFFQPSGWFGSIFWDSHFVMDGLMRAGYRDAAVKFLSFLTNIMRKDGKPFPWMCLYDGTPTVPEERDFAPAAIAAHAMTALKFYEYFRDMDELRKRVYPICKRVADYAIENLFSEVDGKWILAAPVSNDVVEEEAMEVNQTFTLLWFLVILKKTMEYAGLLGLTDTLDFRYKAILENYYIEKDDKEYYHSRGIRAEEHRWASWIPFLLYPTEGMPFINMELMNKTREKYCYGDLYMRKQGDYQPWTKFMQAASDFRRGAPEEGQYMLEWGLEHTFGPGYFCEIGPRQETVALPPYVTAHGAYISACLYRFVTTSIWEKEIGIFAFIPSGFKNRRLKVTNVVCTGNISVTAEYNSDEMKAEILGQLEGYRLILPIPPQRRVEDIRLYINGISEKFNYIKTHHTAEFVINKNDASYTITLR